jgi:zinc and cadmium transporter
MILLSIVAATAASGLLSVLVAALLTRAVLARLVKHLVSLSAGVLLGTALLHMLPEAFESRADPHALFGVLLGGLLFFWLLQKAELYRHDHHHEDDGHGHRPSFDAQRAGRGGLAVLVGDSVHNSCDGGIVAAAFLVNQELGWLTALAILAHKIPQEAGDYMVLLNAGFSRLRALLFNALAGLAAVIGGVAAYFLVGPWRSLLPYLMVVASSSFIYVAVSDLLPQLQRRLAWRETVSQVAWLVGGLLIVLLAMSGLHDPA